MKSMRKLNLISIFVALLVFAAGGYYYISSRAKMDRTPPILTIDQDVIECSIEAGRDELLAGMSALDDHDGDITDHIRVSDIRIDNKSDQENAFTISYIVFDSSNNGATGSRTLIYTDYHSPRVKVLAPLEFNAVSSVDLYRYVTIEDCIDGDITSKMAIDMGESFKNAVGYGEYDCTVRVTNSVGDTMQLPLTFDVVEADSSKPNIYLTDYLVYTKRSEKFSPKKYLDTVVIDKSPFRIISKEEYASIYQMIIMSDQVIQEDGEMAPTTTTELPKVLRYNGEGLISKNSVKVSSDVSIEEPGIYSVVYSVKHPDFDTVGSVKLTVIVE